MYLCVLLSYDGVTTFYAEEGWVHGYYKTLAVPDTMHANMSKSKGSGGLARTSGGMRLIGERNEPT